MRRRPKVLLDCDGVMSDYVCAVLDFIHSRTGNRHTLDEVTEWDVFKCLGYEHLEPELIREIDENEWCLKLPSYPGIRGYLDDLRKIATVICVSAPHKARSWPGQRIEWLYGMGFTKKEIVQTHAKALIPGDVFVDDSTRNIREWDVEQQGGVPIVWLQSYNQYESLDDHVMMFNNWELLIDIVDNISVGKWP